MTRIRMARRSFVSTSLLFAAAGLVSPLGAGGFAPTRSMRGGSNNYRPGAPIVDRIGGGGFWMTGTVRRAGDGAPCPVSAFRYGHIPPKGMSAISAAMVQH